MSKRKKSGKIYGKNSHWWPKEMPPFLVAAALIDIVLESCEKAGFLYSEIKAAWGLTGCQLALCEVKMPLIDLLALAEGNQNVQLPDELIESYNRHKGHPDCQYLIERINEFIKIGFNREQGEQKVIPFKETWLSFTSGLKALVDFSVKRPDWDTYKLVEFSGRTYDLTTALDGESRNRKHRQNVDLFQSKGWHRKLDRTIKKAAFHWYQCRVVYSSIDDYLDAEADKGNTKLDLKNIQKEIRVCDEATGYLKRSSKHD